ncbi:DUF4132 domain-containing protein [Streptomyces sp. NPDC059002]|uniref:DUF4132 domain-containing protein n=1 Tax=Streptomyces sp. NPDC059002 TaxID=3346690 RepID=UPI0036A5C3C3
MRDDAEVVRLRQLAEWLQRHERECRSQVDSWLVRSLPVPVELLARVWPDEAWQGALRDLVVAPVGADGGADTDRAGFLRDADPERGIGVEQGLEQLFREVWPRPEDADDTAQEWGAYADGKFDELRHATARAVSYGYRVRGGYAIAPLTEDGRALEAAYWLGDDYPEGGPHGLTRPRGPRGEQRGRGGGAVSTEQQLLDAGAVLPWAGDTASAGAAPEDGDALTARAYAHPVLEGRTVIRLVPEAIGPAEDLALEYLGFDGGATTTVGRVRRRSLGFPAWALVNDPANGRHALAAADRSHDALGRLRPAAPDAYARAWLAAARYTRAASASLVTAAWTPQTPLPGEELPQA